jgi:type IX secretion system substrate protein
MKTKTIIVAIALSCFTLNGKAQITLQFTLDTCWGNLFYLTNIGNNEYKYVFLNSATNSFSLKNLDMSPYMTNIQIPGTDSIAHGFTVVYITKTLFDCDSTTIEYAFENPQSITTPFKIFRTNGTLLFQKDSTSGPYNFGGYDGSFVQQPIMNTPSGTVLFLQQMSSTGVPKMFIYSLCANLPQTTNVYDFSAQKSYMKVYPNPTAMEINFQITPPNNQEEFQLVIVDGNAKEQRREKVTSASTKSLDVSNLESGVYYYSLTSKNKVYQTGKFILTK